MQRKARDSFFSTSREIFSVFKQILDSARDHPQIMLREKKLACSDENVGRFVDSGAHHFYAN
jgi:hypothetical protein